MKNTEVKNSSTYLIRTFVFIIFFLAIFFNIGCSSHVDNDLASDSHLHDNLGAGNSDDNSDVSSQPEINNDVSSNFNATPVRLRESSSVTLKWGVPDFLRVSESALIELDNILYINGFDFSVEFVDFDMINYAAAISDYIRRDRQLDLLTVIFDTSLYIDDWIVEGKFESLHQFLNENPDFKGLYHDKQWRASSINEGQYLIPIWPPLPSLSFYFNKEVFDDSVISEGTFLLNDFTDLLTNLPADARISIPFMAFHESFGFDRISGAFLSHRSQRALNIFDYEPYIDLNRAISQLRYEERVYVSADFGGDTLHESENYAIIIEQNDGHTERDGFYHFVLEPIIQNTPRGLAILANSDYISEAFEFLNFLFLKDEIINVIAFGVEGLDYELVNGFPFNMQGEPIYSIINELALGTGHYAGIIPSYNTFFGRPQYIDGDPIFFIESSTRTSPFIEFRYVIGDTEVELRNLMSDFDFVQTPLWQHPFDNFDEIIENINLELMEYGIGRWLAELNRQLEEFFADQ